MTVRPPRPGINQRAADNIAAVLIAATVVLACAGWIVASWLEASAFERVTGKHVSTWDAMFVDLRVQEPAR